MSSNKRLILISAIILLLTHIISLDYWGSVNEFHHKHIAMMTQIMHNGRFINNQYTIATPFFYILGSMLLSVLNCKPEIFSFLFINWEIIIIYFLFLRRISGKNDMVLPAVGTMTLVAGNKGMNFELWPHSLGLSLFLLFLVILFKNIYRIEYKNILILILLSISLSQYSYDWGYIFIMYLSIVIIFVSVYLFLGNHKKFAVYRYLLKNLSIILLSTVIVYFGINYFIYNIISQNILIMSQNIPKISGLSKALHMYRLSNQVNTIVFTFPRILTYINIIRALILSCAVFIFIIQLIYHNKNNKQINNANRILLNENLVHLLNILLVLTLEFWVTIKFSLIGAPEFSLAFLGLFWLLYVMLSSNVKNTPLIRHKKLLIKILLILYISLALVQHSVYHENGLIYKSNYLNEYKFPAKFILKEGNNRYIGTDEYTKGAFWIFQAEMNKSYPLIYRFSETEVFAIINHKQVQNLPKGRYYIINNDLPYLTIDVAQGSWIFIRPWTSFKIIYPSRIYNNMYFMIITS